MGRRDLFTGRSGQLALMSEFLVRGINVAIPEVDVANKGLSLHRRQRSDRRPRHE
jgi:hypothetical protein